MSLVLAIQNYNIMNNVWWHCTCWYKRLQRRMHETSWPTVVSDGRDWTSSSDFLDRLGWRDSFRAHCTSFKNLFLPSSSVSLSYFHLVVPMRKCSGEHSCMSSLFSIAILNGTSFKINNPEDLRLHGINPKPQIRDGEKEEEKKWPAGPNLSLLIF